MTFTTDPKDPRIKHYTGDETPGAPNDVYLVLSQEERSKGLVRPLRRAYRHVGPPGPIHALRDLTEEEQERYRGVGYVKFEVYPESKAPLTGSYWTQERLDRVGKGCGTVTTMAIELSETYARNPRFYGATYCCGCRVHLPVIEFVWTDGPLDGLGSRVGS